MKTFLLTLALLCLALSGRGGDVVIGSTRGEVLAALGEPNGSIDGGSYQLLYYERGKVELVSNVVVKIDLLSEDETVKRRLLREKQEAEARVAAEKARIQRIAEGTQVRQTKLADASFRAMAAPERLAFWQRFKQLYPEVPLGDEYTLALTETEREYARQREETERLNSLARLEQRVASAERRAAEAEEEARNRSTYYYPPLIYGCYRPVITPYVSPLHRPLSPSYHDRIGTAHYYHDYRMGLAPGTQITYGPDSGISVSIGTRPVR